MSLEIIYLIAVLVVLAFGTGATFAVTNTSRKGKCIMVATGVLAWASIIGLGGLTYVMMNAVSDSEVGILLALVLGSAINVGGLCLVCWGGDKWATLADDKAYKAQTEQDNPFSW